MARLGALALLLVTVLLLETTLFPFIALAGYRPDLLLLVVVGVALRDGALPGLRVGFAAGVLGDLLVNQSPVGVGALVLTGVGYIIGLARPYLAPDSLTAPLLLATITGVLGTGAYGLLSLLLGDERLTLEMVGQAAVAVGLYNTLLAPVVFGVVGRLSTRFPLGSSALL